jgi:hypothetical protein
MASFLLAFPPKFYMHSFSPHSCYMSCPYHPSWLDQWMGYLWKMPLQMRIVCLECSSRVGTIQNIVGLHIKSYGIARQAAVNCRKQITLLIMWIFSEIMIYCSWERMNVGVVCGIYSYRWQLYISKDRLFVAFEKANYALTVRMRRRQHDRLVTSTIPFI